MAETDIHIVAEHYNFAGDKTLNETDFPEIPEPIYFAGNKEKACAWVSQNRQLKTAYYIGIDWLTDEKAIYVQPKLNTTDKQIDFIKMLFSALKHPDIAPHTNQLFEIKWESPPIEIHQHGDMLTPLLVVQFLRIVHNIVRKGLKKSYYKITDNLYARVKGKVLVSHSINHNISQAKNLHTYCSFDEFGVNSPENRLIKKTLLFIQHFLKQYSNQHFGADLNSMFGYIMPAFEKVSDDVGINEIKQYKRNPIFKGYSEAIRLSKIILKRFGYSITNTQTPADQMVKTPPFWIDMSKLFELYILGQLKDVFNNRIKFQFQANYGQPDYLLTENQLVIDAKYKSYYNEELKGSAQWKRNNIAKDIRQLSGYARDTKVSTRLQAEYLQLIDCLVIYPDQKNGVQTIIDTDLHRSAIAEFAGFYKLGVKLPEV